MRTYAKLEVASGMDLRYWFHVTKNRSIKMILSKFGECSNTCLCESLPVLFDGSFNLKV